MWDGLSEEERIVATGLNRLARAAVGPTAVSEIDNNYYAILASDPSAKNVDIAARAFRRWQALRDKKKAKRLKQGRAA